MLCMVCADLSQVNHLAAIPAGQVDWRAALGCITDVSCLLGAL